MSAQQRVDPSNPQDLTTPIPAEHGWSEDRPDPVLGQLDPPKNWYDIPAPRPLSNRDGLPKIGRDNKPVLNFSFLPPKLSSRLEPFRMETYFRKHPSMTYSALWHRQPSWVPAPTSKFRNALNNQRRRKGREPYLARDWSRRYSGRPTRVLVELIDRLTFEQITYNTTWTVVKTPSGNMIVNPKNSSQRLQWNFYLENSQPHTPSREVQDALAENKRLRDLARQKGLEHWKYLPQEFLPRAWFTRKKGGKTNADEDEVELEEELEYRDDDLEEFDNQGNPSPPIQYTGADYDYTQPQQNRNLKRARSQDDEPKHHLEFNTPGDESLPYSVRGGLSLGPARSSDRQIPAQKRRAVELNVRISDQTRTRLAPEMPSSSLPPRPYVSSKFGNRGNMVRSHEVHQHELLSTENVNEVGEHFGMVDLPPPREHGMISQGTKRRRSDIGPIHEDLEDDEFEDEEVRAPKRQRLPNPQVVHPYQGRENEFRGSLNTPQNRQPRTPCPQHENNYVRNTTARQAPQRQLNYGFGTEDNTDDLSPYQQNSSGYTENDREDYTDFDSPASDHTSLSTSSVPRNYDLVPRSRPAPQNLLSSGLQPAGRDNMRSGFRMPERRLPSQRGRPTPPDSANPAVSRQHRSTNIGSHIQHSSISRGGSINQAQVSTSRRGSNQTSGLSRMHGTSNQTYGTSESQGQSFRSGSSINSRFLQDHDEANTGFASNTPLIQSQSGDVGRPSHQGRDPSQMQVPNQIRAPNQTRAPNQMRTPSQVHAVSQRRTQSSQFNRRLATQGMNQMPSSRQTTQPSPMPQASLTQSPYGYTGHNAGLQRPRQQQPRDQIRSNAGLQEIQPQRRHGPMGNNMGSRASNSRHAAPSTPQSQYALPAQDSSGLHSPQPGMANIPSPQVAPATDSQFIASPMYTEAPDMGNFSPIIFSEEGQVISTPTQDLVQELHSNEVLKARKSQLPSQEVDVRQAQRLPPARGGVPLPIAAEEPAEQEPTSALRLQTSKSPSISANSLFEDALSPQAAQPAQEEEVLPPIPSPNSALQTQIILNSPIPNPPSRSSEVVDQENLVPEDTEFNIYGDLALRNDEDIFGDDLWAFKEPDESLLRD